MVVREGSGWSGSAQQSKREREDTDAVAQDRARYGSIETRLCTRAVLPGDWRSQTTPDGLSTIVRYLKVCIQDRQIDR